MRKPIFSYRTLDLRKTGHRPQVGVLTQALAWGCSGRLDTTIVLSVRININTFYSIYKMEVPIDRTAIQLYWRTNSQRYYEANRNKVNATKRRIYQRNRENKLKALTYNTILNGGDSQIPETKLVQECV